MIEARTGLKGSATALAAVAAASGGASAADVSAFRPSPVAAPSWDGWYAGASLGASWLNSTQDPSGIAIGSQGSTFGSSTGGTSTTANVPGFPGGLQLGYNWQHANFVYGLEGDFSWIASNSATSNGNFAFSGAGYNQRSASSLTTSSVDALATFRARFGVDFNGTLPYLTVGFALGHLQNRFALTAYNGGAFNAASVSTFATANSSWVPGVVVGGGIEHQLTRQWTLRGEIMWVGFESQQMANPLPAVGLGYQAAINRGGALIGQSHARQGRAELPVLTLPLRPSLRAGPALHAGPLFCSRRCGRNG
jgi:outer membrane immunogenic protein